ncbi:hypothetical protein SESBI_03662 [Sesbania bispinosa]|nr:hypothetical protein SESBI_03662 [Sesbania bispinosa]
MATPSSTDQICLKLLIDEKKNKVLFAQAGKDFVDVLLSFLTLPLGTIARLVSAESNLTKVSVGSVSSLYESVANIDEKLFWTATCKEMLLQPRNSMERYCQDMKLNIDDTEKAKYFICEDWGCSRQSSGGLFSTFPNQRCKCGKPMNRQIYHRDSSANGRTGEEGCYHMHPEIYAPLSYLEPQTSSGETYSECGGRGFTKGKGLSLYMVTDDLVVTQCSSLSAVSFLSELRVPPSDLEERVITIGKNEGLGLLKASLISSSALTNGLAPFLKPVKESFSDVKPTCIRESSAVSRTLRKKRKVQVKK